MKDKIILGVTEQPSEQYDDIIVFPKESVTFDPTKDYIHLYTSLEDFKNKRITAYNEPFIGTFADETDIDKEMMSTNFNKLNMVISGSEAFVDKDGRTLSEMEILWSLNVGAITAFDYNTAKYYNIKRLFVVLTSYMDPSQLNEPK